MSSWLEPGVPTSPPGSLFCAGVKPGPGQEKGPRQSIMTAYAIILRLFRFPNSYRPIPCKNQTPKYLRLPLRIFNDTNLIVPINTGNEPSHFRLTQFA